MIKPYLFIISVVFILSSQHFSAFGHSFESDDSVYLLTLIEKTQTELELAKKNYPSNVTLSMDHSDDAARLVYETFYADEDVANDGEFTKRYNQELSKANITSNALVVVTLVDEVLRNYADSIDLNFDLTNMSNLLYIIPTKSTNNITNNESIDKLESSFFVDALNNLKNSNLDSIDGKNLLFVSNHTIMNYAKHETAKTIAMKINTLFQLYLKSFIGIDKTKLNDVSKLEDDFYKLYSMINKNSSPAEIMKKVHIDIQPTMQKVYNLKIKMQQT
ncbi:MAG TPA: hypothetical protein VFC05_12850 [Nitrososphaeraceae archaeon]|nr:hypothetical protein [Nitrososphaeraceae archaeon]